MVVGVDHEVKTISPAGILASSAVRCVDSRTAVSTGVIGTSPLSGLGAAVATSGVSDTGKFARGAFPASHRPVTTGMVSDRCYLSRRFRRKHTKLSRPQTATPTMSLPEVAPFSAIRPPVPPFCPRVGCWLQVGEVLRVSPVATPLVQLPIPL